MELRGENYLLMTLVIIKWCCAFTRAEVESHAGLYIDEIGQVFFYPTQWKVVSYVNLKPTQMLWKQVKSQVTDCELL
jgi:hypothetical protein